MAIPANNNKNRQPDWLPGAILLAVAVASAAVLGFLLGARSWPFYLGLAVVIVLLAGSVERLLQSRRKRTVSSASRVRAKLKVIRGGKAYDLEKDDSTDRQRYLM